MINGNDDTAGGQILDEAPTADAEQRITYNDTNDKIKQISRASLPELEVNHAGQPTNHSSTKLLILTKRFLSYECFTESY